MTHEEIRLEIVKTVFVNGSQATKDNPIPKAEELFRWVINTNNNTKPTDTTPVKKTNNKGAATKTTSRQTAQSTK